MKDLCFLIMAGGKGTRFWPLSTEEKPKQFLKLVGDQTMLQMTISRVRDIASSINNIFICTCENYVNLVREQIPDFPVENIIIEPYAKNTAPCIALSAFHILKKFKDSTMVVLPADHLIENESIFSDIILSANDFVNNNIESILTIGIKPYRPETGYGYIKYDEKVDNVKGNTIYNVNKFIEKPNYELAKKYVRDGNYLWNCGIFIWKTSNILNLIREYMSNTYNILSEIVETDRDSYYEVLKKKYNSVDEISIDYGIMEKVSNIYVIIGDFEWDDLGNWSSVERYSILDENLNVERDNVNAYKSKGNIVITKKPILLNNINDLIIVETDDYIMISSKSKEQEIKLAKEYFDI